MLLRKLRYILTLVLLVSTHLTYTQTTSIDVSPIDFGDATISTSCDGPLTSRLIIKNVTEQNYLDLEPCIYNFYSSLPLCIQDEVVTADEAVRHIFRMMSELTAVGTDPSCYPAEMEGIETTLLQNGTTLVEFLWDNSIISSNVVEYSGAFVDLGRDEEVPLNLGQTSTNLDSYSIAVPDRLSHKCYAINGSCSSGNQSSFYLIIIIDTDVRSGCIGSDTTSPTDNENNIPNEVNGGGNAMTSSNANLQIFPNPVKNQVGNLQFQLAKEQTASIYIMNKTGQLIQSVANNEIYRAGIHQVRLATQGLHAGIYFVVLETEGEKSVEKLVVF